MPLGKDIYKTNDLEVAVGEEMEHLVYMKQRLSRHSTPSRTALMVGRCYFQFAEICVEIFLLFYAQQDSFCSGQTCH